MWNVLKNEVDSVVSDLRSMMAVEHLPHLSIALSATIDMLEWIVMNKPPNTIATRILVIAVKSVLNDLYDCADDAKRAGCDDITDRISYDVRALRIALRDYVN